MYYFVSTRTETFRRTREDIMIFLHITDDLWARLDAGEWLDFKTVDGTCRISRDND